jgi:hypothetical protein
LVLTHLSACDAAERRRLLGWLVLRWVPLALVSFWGIGLWLALTGAGERREYQAGQLLAGVAVLALMEGVLWAWRVNRRRSSALALLMVLVVTTLDVWQMAAPLTETAPVRLSPAWQAAEAVIPVGADGQYGRVMQLPPPPGIPNGASWTGHLATQGYDPISPLEWARLTERAGPFIWEPGSAVNRILGARYVMASRPLESYGLATASYFDRIGERDGVYFYENPGALPRAYLAQRYQVEPDKGRALDRIMNGEVDRGELVLLAEDPGCVVSGAGGTAAITRYLPNKVTIRVEADGPGLLALTDQYDDDWQAQIDGEPAELLAANTATRAVCVPAGRHTVKFVYRPWAFYGGAAISGAGWFLVGSLLVGWGVRSRRRLQRVDGW